MDIDAQEENILAEYKSGWAARAARDPDDEILKSGVKPVRFNGGQSFTHLMANLCQDNEALMEHLFEGIAPLRHWYNNPNDKSNKYKYYLHF